MRIGDLVELLVYVVHVQCDLGVEGQAVGIVEVVVRSEGTVLG